MNLPRSAPLSWAVISLATCLLAPPAPAEQGVGGGYWREATPATAAPPAVEEGEDLKVLQLAAAEEPLPGRAPPARGGPGAVEPADEAGAAALEEGDDELPAAGPEEEALEELDGGLGTPPPAAGEEGAEPPAPETSPAPAAPAEAPAGGEAAPAETDEAPPAGEVAPAETDEEAARQRFLPQSPAFQGKRVDIMDGEIPVSEFISFLADYTGLPVLVDAQPNTLSNPITIAAPIRDADGEMVKAILQVNRWLVRQETLPNGKDVLVVESLQTSIPGAEEPKPSRLLKVVENRATEVPGTIRSEIEGVPDDEIVTMLFTLKYRVPTDAISALNSLISSGATAAPRPGVPGARGRAFSAVEIPDTMMMIVTAKFSLIDYIQKLLAIIDVEIDRPERIVHIIEVEEAEVMELVSLIESFLQQSATSMRRGTTATSRIRRTTTAAPRPTG
ncbi:MAG: hypothetical protein JXA90_03365, partial [Planctomycetes bacterium]|nr:hypothetical protein [Planctomycetota bacterium]